MIDASDHGEFTPPITPRLLREFAGLCLLVFGALFALSFYRHGGRPSVGGWLAGGIALGLGLPGLVWPGLIRPAYVAASALTRPIGHVVGLVLLAIIYYGLITPLALAFRLAGRDALAIRRQNVGSYWSRRRPPAEPRSYLRQFQQQTAEPGDLPTAPEPSTRTGAPHDPI